MKKVIVFITSLIFIVICSIILYFSIFTYNVKELDMQFKQKESTEAHASIILPEAVEVSNNSLTEIVKTPEEVKGTVEGVTMGFEDLFNKKYITDEMVEESIERIKLSIAEKPKKLKEDIQEYVLQLRKNEMLNGVAESKSLANGIIFLHYDNSKLSLNDIMIEIGNRPTIVVEQGSISDEDFVDSKSGEQVSQPEKSDSEE